MVSDSVISALQIASEQAPADLSPRLHLANLLLEAGRAAEALAQAQAALQAEPDRLEALRLAAWSAAEAGDTATAARYHRLNDALTGVIRGAAPTPKPQLSGSCHQGKTVASDLP